MRKIPGGNCFWVMFSWLFIRSDYKWELSQRMLTSGSAAPSASTGDTCIAHSLTGTGKYMAAPCQRQQDGEKEEDWAWGVKNGNRMKPINRSGTMTRNMKIEVLWLKIKNNEEVEIKQKQTGSVYLNLKKNGMYLSNISKCTVGKMI